MAGGWTRAELRKVDSSCIDDPWCGNVLPDAMMACALLVIDEETDIDVSTTFERIHEEQGRGISSQEDTVFTIIWHFEMTRQETDLGVLRERYGHLILD